MNINPTTTIKILQNCPLTNNYEHTIYFDSESAQSAYFSGLAKHTMSNATYQRINTNKIRVQIKADELYDCNYVMFQNTGFGNKWFYAFITQIEYVNNITSEIIYEIDVMQTWFFDYNLRKCFVEREHSIADIAGDNLVPENLEMGDYISENFDGTNILGEKSIVVAATFNKDYQDVGGDIYGGVYSGLTFNVFSNTADGVAECNDFITGAGAKIDGIVCIFLMPTAMIAESGQPAKSVDFYKYKLKVISRSDGSPIKNNKLLTYPFNFLYVTNLQGNSAVYHYEYFSDPTCRFMIAGDTSPNPSVVLAPKNYKGVALNFDEKIVLSGWPQLAYNVDSFKAWLAQSAGSLAVNGMATAASAGASIAAIGAATGPVGVGVAAGVGIGRVLGTIAQHALMPNQARGGGGAQTMAALNLLDFAFMQKHIRPEYVTIIDDYFNMYGYATHRLKIPNRNVRPHWTYTKTIGCIITGSIPAPDANKICKIYDNGVTFWKSGATLGDYSLDNRAT